MKTIAELAIEAGCDTLNSTGEVMCFRKDALERFAALVREDEREKMKDTDTIDWDIRPREKQHEPVAQRRVSYACPICAGTLMEDEQPFTALAARQMRDAAVKVCRDGQEYCSLTGEPRHLDWFECAEAIAALPVPEVQWVDLTAQEKANIIYAADHRNPMAMCNAVIAKFKEVNNA